MTSRLQVAAGFLPSTCTTGRKHVLQEKADSLASQADTVRHGWSL